MPLYPTSNEDAVSDAFAFLIAPVTTIPTLVYSSAGYATGEYPLGKPDHAANIRNALGWFLAAGSVYGWNLLASPNNAVWVSGSAAYKVAGHLALGSSWAGPVGALAILTAVPSGLYVLNRQAIQAAPVEQQQSMWQVFSQGLTGTGPGVGGWTP